MTDELSDVYFELFESVEARNQNYIVEKAKASQKSQILVSINTELMEKIWNKFTAKDQSEVLVSFDKR